MTSPTFLLVAAMNEESDPFIKAASSVGASQNGPTHLSSATPVHIGGSEGVILVTGVGVVNASTALSAWLMSNPRPTWVVSVGSAGGLHPEINVGDVVIGSHYRYGDVDARQFSYDFGQVPGMPVEFKPESVDLALTPEAQQRVHQGLLVTCSSFVDASGAVEIRQHLPQALAVDMESAALAHTCFLYRHPRFVSIRGISDLCSPRAGEEFHDGLGLAAERSRELTTTFLASLST